MRYLYLLVFLLPFISRAESLSYLVIEKIDGQADKYVLEDIPVITMNTEELTISTDELSVSYNINDIKNYHFASLNHDSIYEVPNDDDMRIIGHDVIDIYGSDITKVTLTDISGVILKTLPDGKGQINLAQYPSGTYILSIYKSDRCRSVKFVK